MTSFKNFKVQTPLVLQKPFHEHMKFFIKDAAAYFGVNINGWHDFRRYYYNPWLVNDHLKVERLSEKEIEYVMEVSVQTLIEYKERLSKYSDEELKLTSQGSILPLLDELMRTDPVHRRIIDIGSCYSRVFREISLKYPDFVWDMVDFPSNLEEINEDIRTPGMQFHTAYPLDFVEATDQRYDAVIFNRTLAWMGVEQIGAYLNALRDKARYIVFAEPCKILFEPGSLNIDAIRMNRPRAYNGNFLVHNYRAVFENFGYELIHYDADSSTQINTTPMHFMLRGVARPKA